MIISFFSPSPVFSLTLREESTKEDEDEGGINNSLKMPRYCISQ